MNKLAILHDSDRQCESLAERLCVPILDAEQTQAGEFEFLLAYRDGCLKLLDKQSLKKGGLYVEVDPRPGEQHSYPAPKKDLLASAVGKKSHTIVDATGGWGQDSLALFRMGYEVTTVERSPVMAELIADGFNRLAQKDWFIKRELTVPQLLVGNAIQLLASLPESPDCIYLDPMFPPKKKQSAATRKSMAILRDILGDDLDRAELFDAAMAATGRRVAVKSPDHAEPLGGKPHESYQGKLLRYDVYLK